MCVHCACKIEYTPINSQSVCITHLSRNYLHFTFFRFTANWISIEIFIFSRSTFTTLFLYDDSVYIATRCDHDFVYVLLIFFILSLSKSTTCRLYCFNLCVSHESVPKSRHYARYDEYELIWMQSGEKMRGNKIVQTNTHKKTCK